MLPDGFALLLATVTVHLSLYLTHFTARGPQQLISAGIEAKREREEDRELDDLIRINIEINIKHICSHRNWPGHWLSPVCIFHSSCSLRETESDHESERQTERIEVL